MKKRTLILTLGLLGLFFLFNQAAFASETVAVAESTTQSAAYAESGVPIIESDAEFEDIVRLLDQIYDQHGTTLAGAKPPIVFVHGWLGLDGAAACQRQNDAYVDDYWSAMDENFNSETPSVSEGRPNWTFFNRNWMGYGFDVTVARLKSGGAGLFNPTEADCTPIAEGNVTNLMEAIDLAKVSSGQPKVILVGHSMGGLVSRAYLEGSSYRDDVVSVFTLGTPHVGVPVAVLQGMLEFFTLGILTLEEFCISQPVACQFSDDEGDAGFPAGYTGIETFNATHNTRANGVYYHMLGGDAGFSQRGWAGAFMDAILTGPDDGIVPQPSALGTTSADGRLAPLYGPIDRQALNPTLHVETFTDDPTCVVGTGDYVQRHHAFFNQDQWSVQNTCAFNTELFVYRFIPSKAFMDCLSPTIESRTNNHVCGSVTSLLEAPATIKGTAAPTAKYPTTYGDIAPGQIDRYDLWVSAGEAMFAAHGDANVLDGSSGQLTMRLIAPDGTVYDDAYMAKNPNAANYMIRNNAVMFWFDNAMAGHWQVEVEGTAAPTDGSNAFRYGFNSFYSSDVHMTAQMNKQNYQAGEKALLSAVVTGASADTEVTAVVKSGDTVLNVPLLNQGNGRYQAPFRTPEKFGYAQVTFTLDGATAAGDPVLQTDLHLFQIASNNIGLTGEYADRIQPSLSGMVPFHDLTVDVGVNLNKAGLIGVSAELVDAKGNRIAQTSAFDELEAGSGTLTLRFRGQQISNAGVVGPYKVTNVRLIDGNYAGITTAEADDVHTTAPYGLESLDANSKTAVIQSAPGKSWLGVSSAANVFTNHACTSIDNMGPYNPGETINITYDIDKVATTYAEWLDLYFVNGPDGWNVTSQSAPAADGSDWNRTTVANGCNPTGLGYWGVANPYLDPVPNECALSLNNLPTSGSFAGPWASYEWYDLWFEGFEGGTFPPAGWAHWKEDSTSGSGWARTTSQAYSGSASAFHPDSESCNWLGVCDWPETWLRASTLPVMKPGDRLSYWHKRTTGWDGNDDLDIYFNTIDQKSDSWGEFNDNASALGDDDYNTDNWRPPDPGANWSNVTFNMTDYAGHDEVYFAWYYYANENAYIDDVKIERERVGPSAHSFSISYVVDNDPATMCPGSNFVGVSSLLDDDRSGLAGAAMGDLVDYSFSTASCGVAQACPTPVVTFDLTVSTDGSCPGTAAVSVPDTAQDVTFCYAMTNTSPDVTVSVHTFTNDLAPNTGATLDVAPLATVIYSETVNMGLTPGLYTNNSNWDTSTYQGLGQPQGSGANSYFIDTAYTDSGADAVSIEITSACAAPSDPIVSTALGGPGTRMDLSWTATADNYDLYWDTMPHMWPAATWDNNTTGTSQNYNNHVGNPAVNNFYYIVPKAACGAEGTPQHVGEFDFTIVPGA